MARSPLPTRYGLHERVCPILGKGLQPPRSALLHSPPYVVPVPLFHTPMLMLTAQSLQLTGWLTTARVGV
jgi:hypothetical protein